MDISEHGGVDGENMLEGRIDEYDYARLYFITIFCFISYI